MYIQVHGLNFIFDKHRNNYPQNVNIKWYNNDTLIDDVDYTVDNYMYYCQNNITGYNKIVITFNNMNKPYTYLKITSIDDGIVYVFGEDEIVSGSIIEEISVTGETLPNNIVNLEILPKNNIDPMFIRTRPVRIKKDNELLGEYLIDTSESDKTYKMTGIDYVGMLDYSKFSGGMYSNTLVSDILQEILINIPYELDESFNATTINGYLAIQTKRQALQQIGFVIGAVIDCSREDKIIIKPHTNISKTINDSEIIDKKSIIDSITTKISVIEHKYTKSNELSSIYEEILNGTTVVYFSNPYTDLQITNGTIIQSGTNYAIISGTGSRVSLNGYQYIDTTKTLSKLNTYTTVTDLENEKTYDSTLITKINSQDILNNLNFSQKYYKINYIRSNEKVDDLIGKNNEDMRITKLEYDISKKNGSARLEVV